MRSGEDPGAGRPSISVVIPTRNYARFLAQAIDSALAQTAPPGEIWVADDGSTDDTAAVVGRYGNAVKYRRFDSIGVYAVRQAMLSEIRGDWFLNLDADNWLEPDFLEKMGAAIRAKGADGRFAFAYPDMEVFGDSTGRVERPEFDAQRLKTGNYIDMNSVIRTEVARRFGFDAAFNSGQGDYDFFLTLAKNGYGGARVPEARLHYRVHGGSITRNVGRKRNQRAIMRRIVRKHGDFFRPAEARAALAAADNRTLVALIGSRSPFAGFGRRLADWLRFARAGWRHAEFRKQTAYCFCPRRYFASQTKSPDIFYLFRDTPERRAALRRLQDGDAVGLAASQLFGFDALRAQGIAMDCNLRLPRMGGMRETVAAWIEQSYAPRTGIGLGDVCSVRAHLWQMNRARVVVATTDNTGLPAARLKAHGRLRAPLVYVSVGLPERIGSAAAIDPARAARYRKRLACVDRFVAYGHAEAEWLRRWLGREDQVRFVPFGVDADAWRPAPAARETIDVLSLGYDFRRDFGLLADYARRRPETSVCLVTSPEWAVSLGALPPNLHLLGPVPVGELREWMASAKVLALPVKENTYSGATTTLLQGMAMGKACAVSRVGAIREGYGLEDGVNVRWLEPGSQVGFDAAIDALLAQPETRRRLGEAARRHAAENLSWRRYVDALAACLSEWIGEREGI